ncbi:response regulator (plasmid) [Pantoea dispersa]|uniref:ATP-binding protein n=1 Tax=Pantoea dispersa TaxID=59814 RepID=UPI001CA70365|nr:ATP-binding protein [Pantoea dispersa]QZY92922.1 response regulator [Pantoea dispersa]
MRLLPLSLLILLGCLTVPLSAQPPIFTQSELTWIREHPRVTYTVKDTWPQEIIAHGQHKGISREVLDDVSRRSGLSFIYVPAEQTELTPPMMITAVNSGLLSDAERQRWLFTFPWANTMPMIVSKKETTDIRTLAQLEGKHVAVVSGSDYIPWLRHHNPGIRLSEESDILHALSTVDKGENQAAIASGLVMLPILQRHYLHRLAIVAQVPEMASGISMAVNPAYPELRDILDKSMARISAGEAQDMFARWIGIVDIGTPTLMLVLWQYRYPLTIIVILAVLLLITVRGALISRRRAIRSERYKSEFLAIMSHEVRTPMNAIIAALELLTREKSSDRGRQYADLAYSSSQDLLELLNSVLDHEKITRKQLILQPVALQPCVVLEAICDTQRPAAQRKGLYLDFTSSLPGNDRWGLFDPNRLRQIANNLLTNAIKFTDHGGVHMSINESGGFLNVQIEDTGRGISPSVQQRLTQAWQQGEHQEGGSGLGLYICRSLIEQMKGHIEIESEMGKGTRVTFSLPLNACASPSPENEGSAVPTTLPDFAGECSVLLVEDHAANRYMLAEQLTRLNCHYDIAEDGEKALELIGEERYYDIVLLDCGLPGISGYTVARRLRLIELQQERESAVIIAISAQGSSQHVTQSLDSGMNDVLIKPIHLAELAAIMTKWYQPASIQSGGSSVVKAESFDIWPALQDDLYAFKMATDAGERQMMIHHVHRIRGVAQMYQLETLAEYSAGIELSLRKGLAPEAWETQHWIQKLSQLTHTEK